MKPNAAALAVILLLAIVIAMTCRAILADGGSETLIPARKTVVEQDTVDVWCSDLECRASSGRTLRLKWVVPRNRTAELRTYHLEFQGRRFKTIARDAGAPKLVWYTEAFKPHGRQRIVLLAAVNQWPTRDIVSVVAPSPRLALTSGGEWSVYAWVDECAQLPCPAPVTALTHKY